MVINNRDCVYIPIDGITLKALFKDNTVLVSISSICRLFNLNNTHLSRMYRIFDFLKASDNSKLPYVQLKALQPALKNIAKEDKELLSRMRKTLYKLKANLGDSF